MQPGDRRQFKTVGVVLAFAYLCGADEVMPEHLEVAQHCLWDDPVEQPQKTAQVIARIANPVGMRVTQLLLEVEQVLAAADVRNLADATKFRNRGLGAERTSRFTNQRAQPLSRRVFSARCHDRRARRTRASAACSRDRAGG